MENIPIIEFVEKCKEFTKVKSYKGGVFVCSSKSIKLYGINSKDNSERIALDWKIQGDNSENSDNEEKYRTFVNVDFVKSLSTLSIICNGFISIFCVKSGSIRFSIDLMISGGQLVFNVTN